MKILYINEQPRVITEDLTNISIIYVQEELLAGFKKLNSSITIFRAWNFKTMRVTTQYEEIDPFVPYILNVSQATKAGEGIDFYSASVMLDYDFIIPENMEAYITVAPMNPDLILSNIGGTLLTQYCWIKIGEAGEKIPAMTPVCIRSRDYGEYPLEKANSNTPISTVITPALLNLNILSGTLTTITVPSRTTLTLSKYNNRVGIFPFNGTTIMPNKVFIYESTLNAVNINDNPYLMKAMYCLGYSTNQNIMSWSTDMRRCTDAVVNKNEYSEQGSVGYGIYKHMLQYYDIGDSTYEPYKFTDTVYDETVNTDYVTEFHEFRFFGKVTTIDCCFKGTYIYNLILPPTVTSIAEDAFYDCALHNLHLLGELKPEIFPDGDANKIFDWGNGKIAHFQKIFLNGTELTSEQYASIGITGR